VQYFWVFFSCFDTNLSVRKIYLFAYFSKPDSRKIEFFKNFKASLRPTTEGRRVHARFRLADVQADFTISAATGWVIVKGVNLHQSQEQGRGQAVRFQSLCLPLPPKAIEEIFLASQQACVCLSGLLPGNKD
jgi:hypothetical protein